MTTPGGTLHRPKDHISALHAVTESLVFDLNLVVFFAESGNCLAFFFNLFLKLVVEGLVILIVPVRSLSLTDPVTFVHELLYLEQDGVETELGLTKMHTHDFARLDPAPVQLVNNRFRKQRRITDNLLQVQSQKHS